MKKSLLIISCAKCKVKTPGVIPAYERYHGSKTGGVYPMLHKAINDGYLPENLDILIISAKYGLLEWDEPIEYYNQKMDDKRISELRSSIQADLESYLSGRDYDQIFINLGEEYRKTLRGFNFDQYIKGVVKLEKCKGNGEMNAKMKDWIMEMSRKEKS